MKDRQIRQEAFSDFLGGANGSARDHALSEHKKDKLNPTQPISNSSFTSGIYKLVLSICLIYSSLLWAAPPKLYWWLPDDGTINFGDQLSHLLIERMVGKSVLSVNFSHPDEPILLGIGTILKQARDGDIVWGSGSGYLLTDRHSSQLFHLDVRAVRGPLTRNLLLQQGIDCPEIYGDPALLFPIYFPEFKRQEPIYEYIIIPHISEMYLFLPYKNVVYPTEPWHEILDKILKSKFVISSSLHGIILAEAFGVPARMLVMNLKKSFFKYTDYYLGTGRESYSFATSVHQALELGGESPPIFDPLPLIQSFPYELFLEDKP